MPDSKDIDLETWLAIIHSLDKVENYLNLHHTGKDLQFVAYLF